MKKIFTLVIVTCSILMLPQCRKANVQPVQNGGVTGELIEMTLQAGNGDGGKSSIDGLAINWQVGDRMYVVDNNKGLLGHLTAAEVSSTNTTIAVFKGFITKPSAGDNCMFYFVGDDPFTLVGDNYTYDISVQYGTLNNIGATGDLPGYGDGSWKGDGTNIANSLQLVKSDNAVTITDDMLANRNFGDGIIMMRSMMALSRLDLRINSTPFGGRDNDIVTVSGAGCYATATLNTKTGELTPHLGDITLKKASGNYCMVLIPQNQTTESTHVLTFIATSQMEEETSITAKVQKNKFFNYSTAKVVDMDNSVETDEWINFNDPAMGVTGLPRWAKKNLGATNGTTASSYYGNYYAWGETKGYGEVPSPYTGWSGGINSTYQNMVTNNTAKTLYSWTYYKWGDSATNLFKYNVADGKTELDFSDDIIAVSTDGVWQTPSAGPTGDWHKMRISTLFVWTDTYKGIENLKGYVVYKVKHEGDKGTRYVSSGNGGVTTTNATYDVTGDNYQPHMFLPAAGFYWDSLDIVGPGYYGDYWANNRHLTNSAEAYAMGFNPDVISSEDYHFNRSWGFSLRAVHFIYDNNGTADDPTQENW